MSNPEIFDQVNYFKKLTQSDHFQNGPMNEEHVSEMHLYKMVIDLIKVIKCRQNLSIATTIYKSNLFFIADDY